MFQTTNQIENQWPFQEPKLEVPTICFGPICQGYFSGDIPSKYGQKYENTVDGCLSSHYFVGISTIRLVVQDFATTHRII